MLHCMLLRLSVLVVCGLVSASADDNCYTPENMKVIQTVCKQENEDIVFAESLGDNVTVCRNFYLVFKCAVTALPNCYSYVESLFATYTHSPFSCQLTGQMIMELQEIYMKSRTTASATEKNGASATEKNGASATEKNGASATEKTGTSSTSQPGHDLTRPSTDSTPVTDEATGRPGRAAHKEDNELRGKDNGAVVSRRVSVALLVLVTCSWFS